MAFVFSFQDYLGAVIVLTAAVAAIWTSPESSLVGLGLTYALTVSYLFKHSSIEFLVVISDLKALKSPQHDLC